MAWFFFAIFIAAIAIGIALRPKTEGMKPAGIDEINAPTAEVGREIPVLFGTREITGSNVVWYGDLEAVPIKKKGGKK